MSDLFARSDLWVIGLYMLGTLWIAWYVARGAQEVEGYTVGNRDMPGWIVGLSVLGTYLSSITFLGLPAKTYESNWNAAVFGFTLPVAAVIAVYYFIPLYRQGRRISAYELLEERFGYWARCYAVLSYTLLQLVRFGTVQLLVAFAVEPLVDWPGLDERTKIVWIVIASGVIVIFYDTIGGIKAAIWTDIIQVLVLALGAVWCLAVIIGRWPGGPLDFFQAIPQLTDQPYEKISLGQTAAWDLAQPTVLVMLLYGLSENVRNYGTDQNYVQRMLAARSTSEAVKSFWIGGLTYVPLSIVFCLIGTGLFMYYQVLPESLPEGIKPDKVFPYFIKHELPDPITGLVVAAILAAAMSTIDSSLNSTSTVILVDIIRRWRWGAPRIPEIYVLRGTTVALGIFGTAMAAWLYLTYGSEGSRTLMDRWWQYAGIAGGGLFGLFLMAWLIPWAPRWSAALGVLATFPVLLWGLLLRDLPEQHPWKYLECPLHPNLVGIAGTLALVAVGGLGALGATLGVFRRNEASQG